MEDDKLYIFCLLNWILYFQTNNLIFAVCAGIFGFLMVVQLVLDVHLWRVKRRREKALEALDRELDAERDRDDSTS